ncbi:hypothetical protein JX266_002923 [Neoarthrinium moseri]|nr:hypothetical protein JX266_002923 [Neoarthrinium moseri]
MANDTVNPPQASHGAPRHSRASTSTSRRSYGSYETGESSTAARGASTTRESTMTTSLPPEPHADERPRKAKRDDGRRRSHKPRPTGGFLLSNPVLDESHSRTHGTKQDDERRRSRIPTTSRRAKSPFEATPPTSSSKNATLLGPTTEALDAGEVADERSHGDTGRPSSASMIPSPRPDTSADIDSTQIVNMALNLSESRRMAQRRNVSSPIPPRLAQLPDAHAGSGLKQHLQQQRRTSRNLSPKPDRSSFAPRNVSVSHQRLTSPLQTSFDPDSSYTYHFSSSTLNRAQKAKEHFELMAQYRRLLHLIPPMQYKGQALSRPSTSSPPTSPITSSSSSRPLSGAQATLGRPYNPLQYIRNRKVRARERKAIDGEAQGFADVNRVTDWVDQAATLTATSPLSPESSAIPPFPGAHSAADHGALSNNLVHVSSGGKPKRPRIDWIIEPADMLADVYWVEQEDNKSLIENRHYSRLFPLKATVTPRPMSQENYETLTAPLALTPGSGKDADSSDASAEMRPSDSNAVSRTDTQLSHTSARDRARQKLHELRGMHHRHDTSTHSHHDFLHLRRNSLSDTSDSDIDRQKRERGGTVSASSKAILEKQMKEMLAREAIEAHKETQSDASVEKVRPQRPTLVTPERSSEPSIHDRIFKGSRVEIDEVADVTKRGRFRQGSPVRSGRTSLEVPGWTTRASMDLDTSLPPSPDLKALRSGGNYMPTIGMDLSPPGSRPGSPVRKPFSKVKNIFRDRSRERGNDRPYTGRDERLDSPSEDVEKVMFSPVLVEGPGFPRRQRSKSPMPQIPRVDTHKSHKSMGSVKLGKEDQIGLRSILKGGAKIDGIIRGGVSKVSDLLWRKDQDSEATSSTTSSDDSDSEPARGRRLTSAATSRSNSARAQERQQGKTYLDRMPPFRHIPGPDQSLIPEGESLIVPLERPSQPPSRRSSRFEKLKPPRIDVLNASPTSPPIDTQKLRQADDAEISDLESRSRDSGVSTDGVRQSSSQLNAILSLPVPSNRSHHGSPSRPRHWSISDRSPSPQPPGQLSKREVARLRAVALSSGIKAMEIARRAGEPHRLSGPEHAKIGLPWVELSPYTSPDHAQLAVPQLEVYPTMARLLASNVEASAAELDKSAHAFAAEDMHVLRSRVDALHARVATDLIDMTRRAADEADECSRDVVDSQRLKVKRVVDIIDKMLRRRRRRFRWARRGGWLMVEWALVGFMWYVWFVVMIFRVFLGLGRGIVGGVRWLLWL